MGSFRDLRSISGYTESLVCLDGMGGSGINDKLASLASARDLKWVSVIIYKRYSLMAPMSSVDLVKA